MEEMKMSSSSWIRLLKKTAQSLAKNRNHGARARVALVGIGNEINGDDGAGVRIIHTLSHNLPEKQGESSPLWGNWLLIEAGLAPENFTGTLRRFLPDLVVLIDAADMGLSAGDIACLEWTAVGGWSASTHTLPLNMLSSFLVSELGCQVMVLGIQPVQMEMDQPLSQEVTRAVDEVIAELQSWMSGT
jgi:hydrogenase 3 maturation protease